MKRRQRSSLMASRRKLQAEQLEDRRVLATFLVTTNAEFGEGSLRSAMELSNSTPGTDEIHFSLPASELRIAPEFSLPWITDSVVIDATTQPGYSGLPLVELTGDNVDGNVAGFHIAADNTAVRGLAINGFTNAGIFVGEVSGAVIQSNIIGADPSGEMARPNAQGISLYGSTNAIVGGGAPELGNLISGNDGYGIVVSGNAATNNRIQSNIIGANVTGTKPLANTSSGVFVDDGARNNYVGTDSDGHDDGTEGNLLSGNGLHGVVVRSAHENVVAGNFIGTDIDGLSSIGNLYHGVQMSIGASGNKIGGPSPTERNVISGNGRAGVQTIGAVFNHIAGNFIGVDVSGTKSLGNDEYGILFRDESESNIVGTNGDGVDDASERNVISGNRYAGVFILNSHQNVFAGNYIGVDASGIGRAANNVGVRISTDATDNLVGTNADGVSDELERNIIAGNVRNGVEIDGGDNNQVAGNWIGLAADGVAIPNRHSGVWMYNGAMSNMIGGSLGVQRNVISGNTLSGVSTRASGNTIIGNYIGTSVDGMQAIGNQSEAVLIYDGANENQLGDGTPEGRNVISGGASDGVHIRNASENSVVGNWIGFAADGRTPLGNAGVGVRLTDSSDNIVGIDPANPRPRTVQNVVVANSGGGILLERSSANRIAGNQLGDTTFPNADGTQQSIQIIDSSNNIFGGPTPTTFNSIVSGSHSAFVVQGSSMGNELYGASIVSSHSAPIDLRGDGVTLNDASDDDDGPHGLQNFPEILSAHPVDGKTKITGLIHTTPDTKIAIDLYFTLMEPSGNFAFLKRVPSIQTGPDGIGVWSTVLSPRVGVFRALTQSTAFGSSEFSLPFTSTDRLDLTLETTVLAEQDRELSATVARGDESLQEAAVVHLYSTDPARVKVPEQVTIAAGDQVASFTVELLGDTIAQPTLDVAIVAELADGTATGAGMLTILRSDVWHNDILALDVNDDSSIAPNDVLAIVNAINSGLGGSLSELTPRDDRFVDTNDDGFLSPIDALVIINYLNRPPEGEGESSEEKAGSARSVDDYFDLSWVEELKKSQRFSKL